MYSGGVPGEAWYDASRGTNHGHGSPPGPVRTAETERILADTGRARFVVALVLLVVLVAAGTLFSVL